MLQMVQLLLDEPAYVVGLLYASLLAGLFCLGWLGLRRR